MEELNREQRRYRLHALVRAEWLAHYGYELSRRIGRLAEAFEICERMSNTAAKRNDDSWLQAWYGHQALILRAWGRIEEAFALLKKKEAPCLELGNNSGLGYCYWSWGLLARAQKAPHTEQESPAPLWRCSPN